jgi:ADP-ribose pyrophosphatase
VPASYAACVTDERGAGGWRRFGEKTVYDNRWVRLGLVDVGAPNGERWDYHVVHLGRIAVALIVDDRDRVLMLWRYRFITEQWGYELLGGLVEAGEDAVGTAAREAEEESGWRPVGESECLVSFEPLPGQVTAPVDVFLWRGAERVGEPTDMEEVGRVEWVPLSWVPELVRRQELLGSGTLVALLYYLASHGRTTG